MQYLANVLCPLNFDTTSMNIIRVFCERAGVRHIYGYLRIYKMWCVLVFSPPSVWQLSKNLSYRTWKDLMGKWMELKCGIVQEKKPLDPWGSPFNNTTLNTQTELLSFRSKHICVLEWLSQRPEQNQVEELWQANFLIILFFPLSLKINNILIQLAK